MTGPRCPLCGARTLAPSARELVYGSGTTRHFLLACQTCGLLLDRVAEVEDALRTALAEPVFELRPSDPFGLDIYTLRSAASRSGKCVVPIGPEQVDALRRPHSPLAAHARLEPMPAATAPVSIGLLCRPGDLDDVLASIAPHAGWTQDIAILLSEPAEIRAVAVEGFSPGAVRIAGRALDEDFGAQRNALQALARTGWMLQLDADETLCPQVAAALPHFAGHAEAQGIVSIGLARRNLVDGTASDVFPDIQYRLNRRGVRYAGRVHERPDRPWQQSQIVLNGAIRHHLSRAHVEARSTRYEAIDPGRGRLEEQAALLVPYRD